METTRPSAPLKEARQGLHAEVEPYRPRNLTADQVAQIYAQARAEAEVQVVSAWANYVLAPHDPLRVFAYNRALDALANLEADQERLKEAPLGV